MDGDDQTGRVIPFPGGRDSAREDLAAFEARVKSHPALRKAQADLAADGGEDSSSDPSDGRYDGAPGLDQWEALDATVRNVAPEYFAAYMDENEFRRRFGFDVSRKQRADTVLFKCGVGLTDREIRLLGRTGNLRFGSAVTIAASKGQAVMGYALVAATGVLMLMGLLAAATPAGQTLRSALIVVSYEAVLVGFCWAFMRMYLRPYALRRRVEDLLDSRRPSATVTAVQTASCSRAGA